MIGEGMIPPHDRAIEEAVLGASMLETGAVDRILSITDSDSFYFPEHQHTWTAIKELKRTGTIIDLLTVTAKLREQGTLEQAGGVYTIAQLTNKVASAANIEYHARILQQLKASRQTIRIGMDMAQRGFNPANDGIEVMAWAQGELNQVSASVFKRQAVSYKQAWTRAVDELNQPRIPGVKTGLRDLDDRAGSLDPGDVTIIAARPGMGKTVLAMEIAINVAETGKGVAFFSLEMPESQLLHRIMSRQTGINLEKIRSRNMTEQEADQLLDTEPQDLPIYIDDTAQITPMELGGKIAAIKAKHGCTLVLVDYIQIMRGNEGRYPNREAEVSSISRDLKAIAKREGVHIIALAQLSRETEKRSNPQPKLSDLRESGAIEQDADNIWFIYRPEYYTETPSIDDTVEVGKTGVHVPLKGHTTIICEKFRNGPTFRAYLRSDLAKMRFFSGPEGYGHRVLTFDHNHYPELFQDQGAWQEQPQAPF